MKTKISIVAVIIMAFTTIAASPVPVNTYLLNKQSSGNGFGFVRSHRQGKGAEVSWSFSDNAAGFSLRRTYEDPTDPYAFWENIGDATNDGSHSYRFKDGQVAPGFVSYQIVASLPNGSHEVSDITTVHIAR